MSTLNQTPSAGRLHISFFGCRNAGKSSVVNAVTGQELSIGFVVLSETFSADNHGKCHKYQGQWNGYKRSPCNSPVQRKQSDKADYRKQDMSASYGII